ncbi:hypothetical protein HOC06_02090 [Candidatus Woesearchaeota archaeon]|nr:hypothetical protein [Candidatus Woesearchaeota archaeon]
MSDEEKIEGSNGTRWWPLVVFIVIVSFSLGFLFFGPEENVRFTSEPTTGCVVMQDRGDYENSINIVFLGTEYKNLEQFREDSEKFMLSFLSVVPHNSYRDRFNFFRVENFGDYGCEYDDAVVCDPKLVQRSAVMCPGQDMNVVLVSRDKVNNFFKHLRSSAWHNLVSLNSVDDPLVLAHEWGHIGPDFADEYVFGGRINWDAPNCDSEYSTCPKFSVVDESECHVGCVNDKNSRSVFYGIMSNYWKSDRFGPYNEWYIEKFILEKTKATVGDIEEDGAPKEPPEKIYVVSGNCDVDGNCEIEEVQMSPVFGYATESKLIDSTLKINHGEHSISIPKQPILFKDYGDVGSMEFREYEFVVAIPVDKRDDKIILVENEIIKDFYLLEEELSGWSGYSKVLEIG